jgi:tetratricopeptide (TPR) repeat protein
MIKLNCPSCGGALDLPADLDVAHCIYCGTKILMEHSERDREQQSFTHYLELAEVAYRAKNYNETIQYCNKVLEIAPNNLETWIRKALATWWLTTGENNRYNEATEYLKKASQIAPEDARIASAEKELVRLQAWWYHKLGLDLYEVALKIWNIYDNGTLASKVDAVKNSFEQFNKAMNYLLLAASYTPDDITLLMSIEGVANTIGQYVTWGDAVYSRIGSLILIRARQQREADLVKLKSELWCAEDDLKRLRLQKGLLIGRRIAETEKRIAKLKATISKNQRGAVH